MRFFLKRRTEGQIEFGIVFGGIALLALCIARFLPVSVLLPSCLLHTFTGLPCPTCGTSRSIMYLSQGDVFTAIAANPLSAFGMIAAVLIFFYSLTTLLLDIPRLNVQFTEKAKNVLRVCAVFLVFLNWFYLVTNP